MKVIKAMRKHGKPMSTPEIGARVIGKVTVSTMRKLEMQGIVEVESVRHFSKPFDKNTKKPIAYSEIDNYDKDQIFWVPAKVYIWKLTKKGLKYAS